MGEVAHRSRWQRGEGNHRVGAGWYEQGNELTIVGYVARAGQRMRKGSEEERVHDHVGIRAGVGGYPGTGPAIENT